MIRLLTIALLAILCSCSTIKMTVLVVDSFEDGKIYVVNRDNTYAKLMDRPEGVKDGQFTVIKVRKDELNDGNDHWIKRLFSRQVNDGNN